MHSAWVFLMRGLLVDAIFVSFCFFPEWSRWSLSARGQKLSVIVHRNMFVGLQHFHLEFILENKPCFCSTQTCIVNVYQVRFAGTENVCCCCCWWWCSEGGLLWGFFFFFYLLHHREQDINLHRCTWEEKNKDTERDFSQCAMRRWYLTAVKENRIGSILWYLCLFHCSHLSV